MDILFISLVQIDSLKDRGIYHDLLRVFHKEGHHVTVICPVERRTKLPTRVISTDGFTVLQVRTLNVQKTNVIEKGIATASLDFLFKRAIKKHLSSKKFRLILYATPPITLTCLISYLKMKNKAKTYLLLKDIFPQNAVDMGMIKGGGLLHNFFKWQEKKLYRLSDMIGCMSPANVAYLKSHHPEISRRKLEVNPNSVEINHSEDKKVDRNSILSFFDIPENKVLFLYGGNLGKPQGIPFLLKIISSASITSPDAFFIIVGDGTEFEYLNIWFKHNKPSNAILIRYIPREEYNQLASNCDIGLILLHPDFTIPNFPSRLLTYLEYKLPVFCLTDEVSDIGPIAEEYNFGKWSLNGDLSRALELVSFFIKNRQAAIQMGKNGYDYLIRNYDVNLSYLKIISLLEQR
ncbi:glycosyltransferase family 4 protein [Sediminibacterium sp. TEGAF015]|uniref:glycosyltransferase family 4 protein n=1 Tax=Sediminibacterium sp. TEGAF015 TaxID=575378 RepID=UPI0021FEE15D|nr:glycosyltransferase family 4 protein [Sediminibacterium sp. TEGAF015]BDQ13349.1 glycosyltransferase WbuB [Sediminibacterium sp. TEGAF015]